MKQQIFEQIELLKNRGEFESAYESSSRLYNLMSFIKSLQNVPDNAEILKYVPIASVACFEGASRMMYKVIIDLGDPYIENSTKLVTKFDFSVFNEISKKTFSVGEFISHLLPCNRLEDINTNFSTILGVDFLKELSNFSRPSIYEDKVNDFKYFNDNYPNIYQSIKRLFELRHIFCHEIASKVKITYTESMELLDISIRFIVQLEDYVKKILGIDYEKMLPEQIADLEAELSKSDALLEESINRIRNIEDQNHPEQFRESFEVFIETWNACSIAKSNWRRSFPVTANYQYYAALQSLIESNSELIELLNKVS